MDFKVVIRCPARSVDVDTGHIVDIRTFAGMPRKEAEFRCPACRQVHRWSINDARLAAILISERRDTAVISSAQ